MSEKAKKEKKNKLPMRFIIFFIILAVVSSFVLFKVKTGGLPLGSIITGIGSEITDNAEGTFISFDGNETNRFHLSRSGLLIAASDGLRCFSITGTQKLFHPLSFRNPAISSGDKYSAVFDRGNYSYVITDGKKIITSEKAPAIILSVNMSKNGAYTVVTDGPDCRSLVTVFNKNGKEIYKLYSTNEYVSTAAVSPDGKKMATVSFTAQDGTFCSKIMLYNLSQMQPYATVSLEDTMPVNISYSDSNDITVICNDRFLRLNSKGEIKTQTDFNGGELIFTSPDAYRHYAYILDKRSIENALELTVSQRNVPDTSSILLSEDVFSLSSRGNYIAVEFSDRVVVYKSDLTEYKEYELPSGTQKCIVREDASVLAIGKNWAKLLVS